MTVLSKDDLKTLEEQVGLLIIYERLLESLYFNYCSDCLGSNLLASETETKLVYPGVLFNSRDKLLFLDATICFNLSTSSCYFLKKSYPKVSRMSFSFCTST
jgi:hypothetical protein